MSIDKSKHLALLYRRVLWHQGILEDLEEHLRGAHEVLGTTEQRTFRHADSELQGLHWESRSSGFCVHVAAYVPNQPVSLVPTPSTDTVRDTRQAPPPENHSFLEGDIFFVLRGNNIVFCPSGAREPVAISYIKRVLQQIGRDDLANHFTIGPVADLNKIELLHREGVKYIELHSVLYAATMNYQGRQSAKTRLFSGLFDAFTAWFTDEENRSAREVGEQENLSAKVRISFDSRKRGGELSQERLESAAHMLLSDEESEGFSIGTRRGNTVTASQVRIHKKVSLTRDGNSVARNAAWLSLAQYLEELRQTGTWHQ